jgi:hypothetical protein
VHLLSLDDEHFGCPVVFTPHTLCNMVRDRRVSRVVTIVVMTREGNSGGNAYRSNESVLLMEFGVCKFSSRSSATRLLWTLYTVVGIQVQASTMCISGALSFRG